MTEQELRALVRATIAQHLATRDEAGAMMPETSGVPLSMARQHASHAVFVLPAGADTDGPCLIEPSVPCNHCGYCKSYGH